MPVSFLSVVVVATHTHSERNVNITNDQPNLGLGGEGGGACKMLAKCDQLWFSDQPTWSENNGCWIMAGGRKHRTALFISEQPARKTMIPYRVVCACHGLVAVNSELIPRRVLAQFRTIILQ